MSNDWAADVANMHDKFKFHDRVSEMDPALLAELMRFRMRFLREELEETEKALEAGDPSEVVDGLIDLCVVAIGTLDLVRVDKHEAWNRVHRANMAKSPGVKESRPNALGFPDLVKPRGWSPPNHEDNVGLLEKLVDTV